MPLKKTVFWTSFWIVLSLIFNLGILIWMGHEKALEFFAGYIIEKSLSTDNLFLFLVIFSYFGIDAKYQRRVLNYGIVAAFILRLILILIGVTVVHQFHWVLYLVGLALLYSSAKIVTGNENKIDPAKSKIIRFSKRFIPVSEQFYKEKFFVKIKNHLYATPLFIILLLIETTDVVFALDSIPAIFSVTTDFFIIYTSNILAILGLRSLYFFLEKIQDMFIYVKQGVGLILFIAGLKLLLPIFGIDVPIGIALGIILTILLSSIVASWLFKKRQVVLEDNSSSSTSATSSKP